MIGDEAAGKGVAVGGLLEEDADMVPASLEGEVCGDWFVVEQDFEDFFGSHQVDRGDVGLGEEVFEGTGAGYPEVEPGLACGVGGLEVAKVGGEVAVGLEEGGCGGVGVDAEVGQEFIDELLGFF